MALSPAELRSMLEHDARRITDERLTNAVTVVLLWRFVEDYVATYLETRN